jgi:hypothetical protein
MAAPKLICPECETVLRPARPVAPGKKIKCPRCDTVFVAGGDEDEDDPPPRKAASRKASPDKGRKPAPKAKAPAAKEAPKKPAGDDDDDGGVYGTVKEESEEEKEEKKPKITYAPDMSIKDLRGPAQSIVMGPSNKLAVCGFFGFAGWLVLIVLLLIPALFPIKTDKPPAVMKIGPGLAAVSGGVAVVPSAAGGDKKDKLEEEKPGFFDLWGIDLAMLCEAPLMFIVSLLPLGLFMFYSSLVAYGAIQMQNLESRRWGIAGAILAMIPLHILGLGIVSAMVVQKVLGMVIDDTGFISLVALIVLVVEWLACLSVGIWTLVTLFNEDVVAGFEYVAE